MSFTAASTAREIEQVSHFAPRPSGVWTRVTVCTSWKMNLARILVVIWTPFKMCDSAQVSPFGLNSKLSDTQCVLSQGLDISLEVFGVLSIAIPCTDNHTIWPYAQENALVCLVTGIHPLTGLNVFYAWCGNDIPDIDWLLIFHVDTYLLKQSDSGHFYTCTDRASFTVSASTIHRMRVPTNNVHQDSATHFIL